MDGISTPRLLDGLLRVVQLYRKAPGPGRLTGRARVRLERKLLILLDFSLVVQCETCRFETPSLWAHRGNAAAKIASALLRSSVAVGAALGSATGSVVQSLTPL